MRAWAGVVVGAAVAASAVGCSSGGDDDPPAVAPTSAPAPATSTATGPTPTPTPKLPPGCESLLPFTDLDQALGRPLFGETRFVQGVAQPSIGRTGRITCYYGLTKADRGQAPVEVGVSTYVDAAKAADRVTATVGAARGAGGVTSQSSTTVSGVPATVLGSSRTFTVVLAQGDRTVVVTIRRTLSRLPDKAAAAVAEKVLTNWGQ